MQIGYVAKAKDLPPVLMKPSTWIKSARYLIASERLKLVETLVEYALFIFWLAWGLRWLDTVTWNMHPITQAVVAVDLYLAVNYLFELPFTIYRTFVIDETFQFNRSTPELFVKDQLKSAALTLVLASVLSAIVAAIIHYVPMWWLISFGVIFAVIVLLNLLYPTYIAPLFNQFTPLKNRELQSKIDALLEKCGFKSEGVFVVDASKRDNRLNAYFAGLGKSKRVVLYDTLLKKLSDNELLAVLGHELGHFKHGDLYKNIALIGGVLFVGFYIFGHLPTTLYMEIGIRQTPAMTIILFLLLMPVLLFIFMPVISFVSRANEYAADRYAVKIHGNAQDLISALKKLVDENKAFPKAHKLTIFFYHSHPPVIERLAALGDPVAKTSQEDEAMKGECRIDSQ
jgi:STE24 endopeptidase